MRKPDPAEDSSYGRLKAVFVEAQGLTGTDRHSFLTRACGDDRELRVRVERLLEVHDGGGGILAGAVPTRDRALGLSFPERIGQYVVAGVLGVGGMGVVY